MEKFARAFFSIRMMAMGMLVFLLAIAFATFLETIFDTQTAKLVVYNALWFELLLVYLGINLIANIFRYRMYKAEKIAMLMFHLAFIVILIGAGVTRYVSFEGMMIIKEGSSSNFIYSSDPYFWFKANDGKMQYTWDQKAYMTELSNSYNYFDHEFEFPGHKNPVTIEFVDYKKNYIDSLVKDNSFSETTLEIVTNGMQSNYLAEGSFLMIGDVALSYNKKDAMPGVQITRNGAKFLMTTKLPIRYLAMAQLQAAAREGNVADSLYRNIPIDVEVPLETATLYKIGEQQFVLKSIRKNSKIVKMKAPGPKMGSDYIVVKIKEGNDSKLVELKGGQSEFAEKVMFQFNGLTYEMQYGPKEIKLPFKVECEDFRLERYTGSDMASSFESDIVIVDKKNNYKAKETVFMNNVIDYGGYRFFQSGYEPDESGTHLSVNHDFWGTNISYLGYLMMAIGMVLSLFAPVGRFRQLNGLLEKTKEKREKISAIVVALIISTSLTHAKVLPENENPAALDTIEHNEHDGHDHSAHDHSAHDHEGHNHEAEEPRQPNMNFNVMSKEHSDNAATLLVLFKGRFIPLHTLCDQLLRKISRKNKYEDYNAVQTIMSMHMYPEYWSQADIIYVSSKGGIREKMKLKGSHTSAMSLLDKNGNFLFADAYNKAMQMPDSKKNEFHKQVIKLGEKFQVISGIFSAKLDYLTILPAKDKSGNWTNIMDAGTESEGFVLAVTYLSYLNAASANDGSYKDADAELDKLKKFQRKYGTNLPPESRVEMEVRYNKMNIFSKVQYYYLVLGFLILFVFLIRVFIAPSKAVKKVFKRIGQVLTVLTILAFLYHGYGIYMRMIISQHAPWSSGYEAIVFIGWITVLTGVIFAYKNIAVLAGATIMAFFMLFVADMNLLDPEITQLVPVLKSYWLMIHVAVITASYGPLGIACILGIMNIILYTFRVKNNGKVVGYEIAELTYIAEMAMIIGLFMLTIGTFLGGIWANESWGRYWGWDPKETWALVAVLVYAVILHLRFIPALKDKFTFNVLAMWGYSSILFTFFGVNFYLVGLHSYANGEGLGEFPNWLIYCGVFMYIATELASIRNQIYITKDAVKDSYFIKKLALMIGFVVFTAFMLWVLGVSEFGLMVYPLLKILGLILGANLLQFLYVYLRRNKNTSEVLDV